MNKTPLKVDLSLARGLRTSILREIEITKQATNKAVSQVFNRKATMPTTRKGVRKLFLELGKYLDRYALASNEVESVLQFAYWHRWALREDVSVDHWEEDQLSVNAITFDLLSPSAAYFVTKYPVGISMHLIERAFLRLNSTDNEVVTKELIFPTLMASSLSFFILMEMESQGIKSQPIMFVTAQGAIVGDAVIHSEWDTGMLQFRTYLSEKSDFSPAKSKLIQDLIHWQKDYASNVGDILQISTNGKDTIKININNPLTLEARKYARSYLNLLANNKLALENRESRVNRQNEVDKKWSRK